MPINFQFTLYSSLSEDATFVDTPPDPSEHVAFQGCAMAKCNRAMEAPLSPQGSRKPGQKRKTQKTTKQSNNSNSEGSQLEILIAKHSFSPISPPCKKAVC